MPIEITYFQVKGLGEQVRLLLAYGGEDFKDTRLTREEWPAFKPKTPFGQGPVLNIDGKQYAQSSAICRYLGRKYNLAGDDIEEAFEIDQNVEFLNDIRLHGFQVFSQPTEELKDKKHEEKSKVYPDLLKKLEQIIIANNGHLAAGKLTWGDFVFAGQYEMLKMMMRNPDLGDQYPSLKKLYDTVMALPQLQKYLASAPKTDF
uniref:glutathione transferase n=1 Tax=Epiphyas postvittana TaxID=65032 RepID=A0A0K8TUE8_EPIPO